MAPATSSLLILVLTTLLLSSSSQETYYQIHSIDDDSANPLPLTPSLLQITIHNPKPPKDFWYSVTIRSEDKYSGVAILEGDAPDDRIAPTSSKTLVYTWTPPFQSSYEVVVHELPQNPTGNPRTKPLPTQAAAATNRPNAPGAWGLVGSRLKMLPPCQNVRRRDAYSHWDGSWIGPAESRWFLPALEVDAHAQTFGTLRDGWFFLPGREMDCRIEYFEKEDFRLIEDEKRIYVLGTSKERGIFLSLVDLLLDDNEKEEMSSSILGDCHGRAMVSKHNLKVVYQSWDSSKFDTRNPSRTIVCHNDLVAREGGQLFFKSALRVWEEILDSDHPSSWPHVILMSTGDDPRGYDRRMYDINQFVMRLPREWNGVLFLTDGAFSASLAGRGYASEFAEYRARLKELMEITNDDRVRWMDGMGMSKEMRMYGEMGPEGIGLSRNFHSDCDFKYWDGNALKQSVKICSNVTENIAQLLIGHAVGPKAALRAGSEAPPRQKAVRSSEKASICHSCPKSLLPLHITPYPDMTCTTGPLQPMPQSKTEEPQQTCPEQCTEAEVTRKFGTQLDQIHERHCPYEFFPDGFRVGNTPTRKDWNDGDIGFYGRMVWMFNFVLVAGICAYQHRARVFPWMRNGLLRLLDVVEASFKSS